LQQEVVVRVQKAAESNPKTASARFFISILWYQKFGKIFQNVRKLFKFALEKQKLKEISLFSGLKQQK